MKRTLAAAFIATTTLTVACGGPELRTNPPPPERQYDARGIPVDLRADEVFKDEQGVCWYEQDIDCPPPDEATCNPPAPAEVDCPAGA